jgi:hypothetical protein
MYSGVQQVGVQWCATSGGTVVCNKWGYSGVQQVARGGLTQKTQDSVYKERHCHATTVT